MSKKLRAPREQLLEAGRKAKLMLQEKGLEAKKSILDEIVHAKDTPILPGIPYYLPESWTIKKSQQMMYDLLILWKDECIIHPTYKVGDKVFTRDRSENLAQFFEFLVNYLDGMEKEYNKEIKMMPKLLASLKTVPVLRDIFLPVNKRDVVHAMNRFFYDSWNVSQIVKRHNSTTEYANWFLDWTQDLYALWISPKFRDKLKRV